MDQPTEPKPKKPRKPRAKQPSLVGEKLTPLQFTEIMRINMKQASKMFEGLELIQVMSVIYQDAMKIAEKEAGIDTYDERPVKAIGILMRGIAMLTEETGKPSDQIVIDLLDKLGAPHGMPHAAWN